MQQRRAEYDIGRAPPFNAFAVRARSANPFRRARPFQHDRHFED
jgi:hypothetical protein